METFAEFQAKLLQDNVPEHVYIKIWEAKDTVDELNKEKNIRV